MTHLEWTAPTRKFSPYLEDERILQDPFRTGSAAAVFNALIKHKGYRDQTIHTPGKGTSHK